MGGSPGDVSEESAAYEKRKKGWRISCYVAKPHSPTFPSLHLSHSSFSNPSVASPTSQIILQPFFRFSYVTGSSLTSPGEPPMGLSIVCYNNRRRDSLTYLIPHQYIHSILKKGRHSVIIFPSLSFQLFCKPPLLIHHLSNPYCAHP